MIDSKVTKIIKQQIGKICVSFTLTDYHFIYFKLGFLYCYVNTLFLY